jgi:HEAT repeat protein
MARQSLEEKLARLKQLEEAPPSDDARREIRQALSGSSSALAARAARAVAKLGLQDLASELVAAFHRSLQTPVKTDPGCRAKLSIIEALNKLDYPEADVFLHGIRHVQMEPSYGPPVDTADHLRAACAFSLYRIGYAELLCELVTLLMDREPVVRRAAVKVLSELGQETGEMLLRLKVLQGDRESEVLGDCFSCLISIAPKRSLRFVEQFLIADNPPVAEEAALAIGNSRLPEACTLLCDYRERVVSASFKRTLLLAIALTRCEDAFTFLLAVVQDEHPDNAAAAVRSLSIYSDNPERRERIHETVRLRDNSVISAAYEKEIASKF